MWAWMLVPEAIELKLTKKIWSWKRMQIVRIKFQKNVKDLSSVIGKENKN
jgi:hypothetical protein